MNENIEYKKGWQIKKNGSPTSLHNRFNDDKIYGVIDSTGNLGESFKGIYNKTVLNESSPTRGLEDLRDTVRSYVNGLLEADALDNQIAMAIKQGIIEALTNFYGNDEGDPEVTVKWKV